MTLIDRLREAVVNNHGIALTSTEVVALVNEIEKQVAAGPAPEIHMHFTQPPHDEGEPPHDEGE